ncbi:unnamed protein product [Darwinula stevensoni]|uniref:Uncharacterized protein n=1 Tax=Darwinula stevensoni TaxID=69355 RepID=A0A7R9A6W1_9CRUS|nr:unnamed protein product [Darwinula stevensoni]CAG0895826.1 unnamed protein product [Darwinula stevensoni]
MSLGSLGLFEESPPVHPSFFNAFADGNEVIRELLGYLRVTRMLASFTQQTLSRFRDEFPGFRRIDTVAGPFPVRIRDRGGIGGWSKWRMEQMEDGTNGGWSKWRMGQVEDGANGGSTNQEGRGVIASGRSTNQEGPDGPARLGATEPPQAESVPSRTADDPLGRRIPPSPIAVSIESLELDRLVIRAKCLKPEKATRHLARNGLSSTSPPPKASKQREDETRVGPIDACRGHSTPSCRGLPMQYVSEILQFRYEIVAKSAKAQPAPIRRLLTSRGSRIARASVRLDP